MTEEATARRAFIDALAVDHEAQIAPEPEPPIVGECECCGGPAYDLTTVPSAGRSYERSPETLEICDDCLRRGPYR